MLTEFLGLVAGINGANIAVIAVHPGMIGTSALLANIRAVAKYAVIAGSGVIDIFAEVIIFAAGIVGADVVIIAVPARMDRARTGAASVGPVTPQTIVARQSVGGMHAPGFGLVAKIVGADIAVVAVQV